MSKTVYFMLLCFSILYTSCSEDDRYQLSAPEKSENGFKRSIVSYKEVKAKLSGTTGKAKQLISGNASKFGEEGYILSIDSTNIIEYANDTLTTYTFRVSTVEDENYTFSNLIVKVQNGETEEYVAHYLPTPEWMVAHSSGEYLPYEGEGKLVYSDGEPADGTQQGKMIICTFNIVPLYDPDGCSCNGGTIIGYEFVKTCWSGAPDLGGGGGGPGPEPGGPGPGGPPGDGGDGDWPGTDPGLPTDPNYDGEITPCQSLIMKKNDSFFIDKINHLKGLLNSPDENGFFNYNPSEIPGQNSTATNKYSIMGSKTRPDGRKTVRTTVDGPQVFGYMHTHPIHPGYMGVHSTGDISAFAELIIKRSGFNGYSLDNTYCIVVGSHGIYSLKIEDFSKFNAWALQYDTKTKRDQYFEEFERVYYKIREHENTRTNNERSVLKVLNQFYSDLGIGLYRAVEINGAMTGWERMTLNQNNNPTFTNCNQL